jgi:predicted nucleic acid-binding protein
VTTVVLDSSAVVTWILQERGWRAIDAIFARGVDVVLLGPALTEVIDVARRRGNRSTPQQLADAVQAQGVRIEPSTIADLVRAAELARGHPGDRDTGRPM